jgi:glucose dehydrogenase
MYALNARTGSITWKFRTEGRVTSPVQAYSMVVFGSADGNLYAVVDTIGQSAWKFKVGNKDLSAPMADKNFYSVYFGSSTDYLYALDLKTGLLKWKFRARGSISSPPVISEGVLYFGSSGGYLYALK